MSKVPGFALQTDVSKLRVINPESDSLNVESLSSDIAPPCYSSYKGGTTSFITVCPGDSMEHSRNRNTTFESGSPPAHSVVYPEVAPGPLLAEESPSPYSFEDLPKVSIQPDIHNYLGPAAPSSTYTQSCVFGVSRSQSRITQDVTLNEPALGLHSFIRPAHASLPIGHSSTPNISSLRHEDTAQSQVLYRHIPTSQPLLGHLSYLPNVISADAHGEVAATQDEHISNSDGNHSSALWRGFPPTGGSTSFLPTNFVSLSRKSTYKRHRLPVFLSRRKYNSSSIMGTFVIDPHLRLPAGLLKLVESSSPPLDVRPVSLKPRRKNLVLETEDGAIDVDIQIIPSKVNLYKEWMTLQHSQPRRSTDKRYLQSDPVETLNRQLVSEGDTADARLPTQLDLRLKGGHSHGNSGKLQLTARLNAPNPRPPIHLVASTIDHVQPIIYTDLNTQRAKSRRLQSRSHPRSKLQLNKSSVILHLPHNLHGPLTVHITSGNIDAHVRLSKEVSRVAAILSENSTSRGYFISSRGLTEFGDRSGLGEELDSAMEGEDGWVMVENNRQPVSSIPRGGDRIERNEIWYGDKVDVFVGDGKIYLQFVNEPDAFGRGKGFWQKIATGLGCR